MATLQVHADVRGILQRWHDSESARHVRETLTRRVRPRLAYHMEPDLRQVVIGGDALMDGIKRVLDCFGYTRSNVQRKLHNSFLNATAGFLYGDALASVSERVLKENGWKDFKRQTLAMTPRRFGKTTAVAMFAAACALVVPHFEVM